MNRSTILVVIGIVILLLGLAMPGTDTKTSRVCIDDIAGGQNCYTTTYEDTNTGAATITTGGLFVTFVGGILWLSGSGNSDNSSIQYNESNPPNRPENAGNSKEPQDSIRQKTHNSELQSQSKNDIKSTQSLQSEQYTTGQNSSSQEHSGPVPAPCATLAERVNQMNTGQKTGSQMNINQVNDSQKICPTCGKTVQSNVTVCSGCGYGGEW